MEKLSYITKLEKVPFELKWVGDLIEYDGPLLSHYQSESGDNFLYYWCDNTAELNRWYVFRVSRNQLDRYLNKKTSLKNLMIRSADPLNYYVDLNDKVQEEAVYLVDNSSLPEAYIPQDDSLYEFGGVENELSLIDISKSEEAAIFGLKIYESNKVGYGTITPKILSSVLSAFDELVDEMKKIELGKISTDTSLSRDQKRIKRSEVKELLNFNLIGVTPGSFNAILKPSSGQVSMNGMLTKDDVFTQNMFNLFEQVLDLNPQSDQFVAQSIKAYSDFLSKLKEQEVSVNLNYSNYSSNTNNSKKLKKTKILELVARLGEVQTEAPVSLVFEGKFESINVGSGHVRFNSFDGDFVHCYLDQLIKENAINYQFSKNYSITVERTSKSNFNSEVTYKDVILSVIEITE